MFFRIRDLLIASLAIIIFSPLFLLICVLLFFTQKRVFFTQIRPGLDEKPFRLFKFSTLFDIAPGVEEATHQRMRQTPVGKYLRKWSLDELPQLLNIIAGEMSLVGPRPLLMEYLPLYSPEEKIRHTVKPGMTGWAQVNGRNQISFKQKFAYDRWYVQNRTLLLDFKIMWMTVGKVFSQQAVYVNEYTTAEKFNGTN